MEIQRVKLSELKHDKKNARRHDERNVEEIKRSLQEFGQHRPFVVQRGTNKVIVGNGMLDAMLALGMTEGDAYIVDDDEETSIRRALADNRTGELASWDMAVLKDLFEDMGPVPNVPGWNTKEIENLFTSFPPLDGDREKVGASPWERVGKTTDGVMFSCGEISVKISLDTYETFLRRLPETDVVSTVSAILTGEGK